MRCSPNVPLASIVLFACLNVPVSAAEPARALGSTARMPIKEITVFKDGHAFVLHEGAMPVDATGKVLLDALPQPVLGTFWTFSPDKKTKLVSVSANQRKVKIDRTAITIKELIDANPGAEVIVAENGGSASAAYPATILARPTITGEELEATNPPNAGPQLPVKSELVLLKTPDGTRVVPLERIRELTFRADPGRTHTYEEFRNLLSLQFQWPENQAPKQAEVGMAYVQKGIRWIPNYKIILTDSKQAVVQLQATLINELADLTDVTANLVVGVPSFAYAGTQDPIALQQTAAQLSQYFQSDSGFRNSFSNSAIQSQVARMGERRQAGQGHAEQESGPVDLGPELAGSSQAEDLFLYTINHITLAKGGRMVVPVAEFTVPMEDVYTLDIPFTPPAPIVRTFNTQQQEELARLARLPKVQHKVRLTNTSRFPLTTAPALIFAGDRILAQTTMTYTSSGSDVDLGITTAVDVRVKKSDTETNRIANAARWNNENLSLVELSGQITLTSYAKQPVELRVTRHVLGKVGDAGQDGKPEMVNVLEDDTASPATPEWFSWRSWPDWWTRFNGVGRITWNVQLEPGKPIDLGYTWSYYWR